MKTWLLVLMLACTSCVHRVKTQPPVEHHAHYDARRDGPDTFTVAAERPLGDAEAKEDICTSAYVCVFQEIPLHIYIIQRTHK